MKVQWYLPSDERKKYIMLENQKKIGVIAGTPIDTQMGVEFVCKRGCEAVGFPTASGPEEQNLLQFMQPDALMEKVIEIIRRCEDQDIFRIMIYCNSLSSAINLEYIRRICPKTKLVTPLDIYKKIARNYKALMIWAANGQCLETIEKIFYNANPSIQILGISMLPVICDIESLKPADLIVNKYNLDGFLSSEAGLEGLVLGCTHLPYLKPVLEQKTHLQIIDPAEIMLQELLV